MSLPPNVLRARASTFEPAEGFPAPFACEVVELWPLGLQRLGAHIARLLPGARSAPLHSHAFEEEVFFVLSGVLTVREREPSGQGRTYELREGEAVVYPPGTGLAHCFSNTGTEPVTYLALSDDHAGEVCSYPDSGKTLLRSLGAVGVFANAETAPAIRSALLRDGERPAHVVVPRDLPERDLGGAFGRPLSAHVGARSVFVHLDRLPPGGATGPLHWHTADEELVFVLAGRPTLVQLRSTTPPPSANPRRGRGAPDFAAGVAERAALAPWDVAHFAPHHPVAHRLVNESDEEAVLIVVGTNDPQDITVLPESGRVHVRALARTGSFEPRGYWDGEA